MTDQKKVGPMPFIVIENRTGWIAATIDRDDLPTWLAMMGISPDKAGDYRTQKIPGITVLRRRRSEDEPEAK